VIDRGRHNVLGIGIDAVDYPAAVDRIALAASASESCSVSALAVHGVMTGVLDSVHRYRLNQLDMIVPDGQPVRWALNWLHHCRLKERVYGPNLMLKVCERAAADGLPIFLFGGTQQMLDRLQSNLLELYPSLKIVGARASLFRQLNPEETAELVAEIRSSGAKITFAGIGCPRQEIWAYEFRDDLSMPILAVGAAFAFHAKMLSQAPEWMQRHGLEWLYRFTREPLRLWKRYVFLNPLYLLLLLMQKIRLKTFIDQDPSPPATQLRFG